MSWSLGEIPTDELVAPSSQEELLRATPQKSKGETAGSNPTPRPRGRGSPQRKHVYKPDQAGAAHSALPKAPRNFHSPPSRTLAFAP